MRLKKVQKALKTKNINYEYTEENGCGSIDFMFRGLRFHIWEYEDRVWGAETNVFEAGRSQDIEGAYEDVISDEILSWPEPKHPAQRGHRWHAAAVRSDAQRFAAHTARPAPGQAPGKSELHLPVQSDLYP